MQRGGTVEKCFVSDISIDSHAYVKFNKLKSMSRAAGIVGYANSTSITDCLVTNAKKIYAFSEEWGENLNKADLATAYAGGLVGELTDSVSLSFCVVYNNANITSRAVGNENTAVAEGYFAGCTTGTAAEALIYFDPTNSVYNWPSGI